MVGLAQRENRHRFEDMQQILALFLTLIIFCAPAFASEKMAADIAHAEINAGRMVLVDVRTPSEWKATGVAPGAVTLTMGEPGFVEKLKAVVDANPGKRVALICAAGGRSTSVQRQMAKLGIAENTVDIVEGMKGNWTSPGWIGRGLPVAPYTAN
jgi:rhodanese-related sulfurtransferase